MGPLPPGVSQAEFLAQRAEEVYDGEIASGFQGHVVGVELPAPKLEAVPPVLGGTLRVTGCPSTWSRSFHRGSRLELGG
jgi:hypothetical protein